MNWLSKIRKKIEATIKKREDNRELKNKKRRDDAELKKSNWGRSFGWFIELNGEIIGELVDDKFDDMFWVRYTIVPYDGFEEFLFNHQNWDESRFKYRNKHYPQYVDAIHGRTIDKEENKYTISMRALYLLSIEE